MKVYCEECSYNRRFIKCDAFFSPQDYPMYEYFLHGDCLIINFNNDCDTYKRKWYKFWIKEMEKR